MKIYALLGGGMVYNIIETDDGGWPEGIDITDIAPRPGIGWTYSEEAGWMPPAVEEDEPPPDSALPPVRRIVTTLAFDLRFTLDEQVAIDLASIDNPTAPMEQRAQAAALRVSKERARKATFIDLDDPVTRDGVLFMEQAGLLAAGRALDILDAPVADGELPWNI